jgi:hypothetical protein
VKSRILGIALATMPILAVVLVIVVGLNLSAHPPTDVQVLCLTKALTQPIEFRHPVGCETIDCCPGCPAPEVLTWEIAVTGDLVRSLSLRFDNLSRDAASTLALTGRAKWGDASAIDVGVGASTISGLPARLDVPVVVASARVALDPDAVERLRARVHSDQVRPSADLEQIRVSIVQRLGRVAVREYEWIYIARDCAGDDPPGQDEIRLLGMAGSDQATVLVAGRQSASSCTDDALGRTTANAGIGNFLSPATCNADVSVFAVDNAMQIVTSNWTAAAGDVLDVTMAGPISVPLTIWIVKGPFAQRLSETKAFVKRANELYNNMQAGVKFDPVTTISRVSAGVTKASCADAATLKSQVGFTAGQLNVYYVRHSTGDRGETCRLSPTCTVMTPNANPAANMILVNTDANDNETLAHEIGHAFSL